MQTNRHYTLHISVMKVQCQLAAQTLARTLFSITDGSALPSHTLLLTLSPHLLVLSPFLLSPLSNLLSHSFYLQVQVTGCNLSNVSPSPFSRQSLQSPPPCLHSPLHIWRAQGPYALFAFCFCFFGVCVFFPWKCNMCVVHTFPPVCSCVCACVCGVCVVCVWLQV